MMVKYGGKNTLGWRAHRTACRRIPSCIPSAERMMVMDYFRLAFALGYAAARRDAKRKPHGKDTFR